MDQNGWFTMKQYERDQQKIDDLGVSLFEETPIMPAQCGQMPIACNLRERTLTPSSSW